MIVKPFRGLRPRAELAPLIASVPYDVVDTEEARRLAEGNPHSFLHVTRPEIDFDPETDPYDDAVYARGAQNLTSMVARGWLQRDDQPAYYVYRLTMDGKPQTGILGAAAVADYEQGRIKKHEHTRPEKVQDRVKLNDALSAHPGPVFLTYRGLPELNAVVNGVVAGPADVDFVASDGIRHELWVVDDAAETTRIQKLLGQVRESYVADGHHRAAAAARVSAARIARAADEPTADDAACRFFLAAHFPSEQLRVLDYNRVIRDLNGLDALSLIDRLRSAGMHVKPNHRSRRPVAPESFGMYVAGTWYLLTPSPDLVPRNDVVGRLDVSVLTDRVMQPILGIGDPRTDKRVEFVGGIRGMDELERLVDSGRHAVAFALYPTRLEDVMAVADAGRVMPPKSTWFEPKLRSGLVVQLLD